MLKKICGYAGIKESEIVLEIGAGTGNLTEYLVDKSKFVYAVEKNRGFYSTLKKRFAGLGNIEIINADALKIDLPEFDKVVSNLPYDISRRVTERLLKEKFRLGVLVYQKEFTEKLTAKPKTKSYRFISALTQSCADVEVLDEIPPKAFNPKPRVYSRVVRIKPRIQAEEGYINFLHHLFNQRNKKIKNLIKVKGLEDLQEKRVFELNPTELSKLHSHVKPDLF